MNNSSNNFQLSSVINEYVNRGFGSMNKNDFEVWIFNYLLQNDLHGKSNYDVSVELRIPESKVKRFRYEASLKYGNPSDKDQYNAAFKALLNKVNLKKGSDKTIQFAVEDIQLRKYLDSILKKKGRFADTSFNSEVVSITIDDLAELLNEVCTEKEKQDLLKKAKEKNFVDIAKKALEKILNAAITAGMTQGIDIAITALVNAF